MPLCVQRRKKNIIIDDTINLTRLIMCRRIRSVYARIRLSTHHGVTSMQIKERKNFRCPKNHGRIAFCFASAQQLFHILTLHAGRLMDYNLSTCLHTQHILHSFRNFVCNFGGTSSPLGKIYKPVSVKIMKF